jgi:hypothetical protein
MRHKQECDSKMDFEETGCGDDNFIFGLNRIDQLL